MADTYTNLHPEGDLSTNVYPNVQSDNIPSSAVTTEKIANSAVTAAKIASGAISSHADFQDFLKTYFRGKYAGGAWDSAEGNTLLGGFESIIALLPSSADFTGCFAHAEFVKIAGNPESNLYLADLPDRAVVYGMFNYFKGGISSFLRNGYALHLGDGYSYGTYMFAHMGATSAETGYSNCGRIDVASGKSFRCYGNCTNMFYADNSLTAIVGIDFTDATSLRGAFDGCTSLTTLDVMGISVSFGISATALEHDALVTVIANLATVTSSQTLTMGDAKLALLSDSEKQVATDKGWTLA